MPTFSAGGFCSSSLPCQHHGIWRKYKSLPRGWGALIWFFLWETLAKEKGLQLWSACSDFADCPFGPVNSFIGQIPFQWIKQGNMMASVWEANWSSQRWNLTLLRGEDGSEDTSCILNIPRVQVWYQCYGSPYRRNITLLFWIWVYINWWR